jgi:lipid-A-disaccharide synthase
LSRRILMLAGEASGDALGARLATALKRADPSLHLYGAGGDAMREAGVETIVDSRDLGVMGFAELGREVGRVLGALRRLRRELREGRPDLFVPIDFPDFNLPLCRTAHRAGVRVFYYVSPQVWAWRQGRIDTIARHVTRMLVLFPFEAELYRARGIDAHFVGHPQAERVLASRSREQVRAELGLEAGQRLLALLPGSRRKEVELGLPPMLEGAALLGADVVPVVAESPSLAAELVPRVCAEAGRAGAAVRRCRGRTYDLLGAADAAVVTSGTATLEAALLGCPMVVAYRMSAFSHALARRLVKVPFIAMPNLLLGRAAVAELVQGEASPARIAAEVRALLADETRRRRMQDDFDEIRRLLVLPGAADRAAALALELL